MYQKWNIFFFFFNGRAIKKLFENLKLEWLWRKFEFQIMKNGVQGKKYIQVNVTMTTQSFCRIVTIR